MTTFEDGFAAAEKAADSVLKTLGDVSKLARQIQRDARAGNIAAIRRGTGRLRESLSLIQQEVSNAAEAWPFTPEEERSYLEQDYAEELRQEASKMGLQLFERDGRLIAHPSVVRVLPGERALRIDRGRSSSIRPTKIVAELEKLQTRPLRSNPQQFLELLYADYMDKALPGTADRLKLGEVGQVIQLNRIYESLTRLPEVRREYGRLDFARQLYNVETSGIQHVSSGARVSFPASTGTRNPRGTFSFVRPDGEPVVYYGIQFAGAGQ